MLDCLASPSLENSRLDVVNLRACVSEPRSHRRPQVLGQAQAHGHRVGAGQLSEAEGPCYLVGSGAPLAGIPH
jgi:hypothetical protein